MVARVLVKVAASLPMAEAVRGALLVSRQERWVDLMLARGRL